MSSRHSALIEAVAGLEEKLTEASYLCSEAVGIAVDDVDDPHAAVAVHDGQIVYMGLSDPLLALPPDELADIINALIATAFGMWRAKRRSL